jgi:hypothetical protein
MMRLFKLSVTIGAALLLVSSARATNIAGDYTGGGSETTFPNATGYWFTPKITIDVIDLGYYSPTGAGLASSHNVGIFTAGGTELVSALIPLGTAATFVAGTVGGTWTEAVAGTILTAGTEYYILADNNTNDSFVFGNGAVVYNSAITWNSFGDAPGPTITSGIPTMPGGLSGNLGPNFQFNAAAIPEPGTAALMLSAAAVLLGGRRLFARKA